MATSVRKAKAAFASPRAFKEAVTVPDAPIEGSAFFNKDLLPTPPEERIWNTLHFFSYYLTQTFSSSSYNLGATLISIGLHCKQFDSAVRSYLPVLIASQSSSSNRSSPSSRNANSFPRRVSCHDSGRNWLRWSEYRRDSELSRCDEVSCRVSGLRSSFGGYGRIQVVHCSESLGRRHLLCNSELLR